jgi:hypothetical protein
MVNAIFETLLLQGNQPDSLKSQENRRIANLVPNRLSPKFSFPQVAIICDPLDAVGQTATACGCRTELGFDPLMYLGNFDNVTRWLPLFSDSKRQISASK